MAEKITKQVQEIFKEKEQWEAFLELIPNKDKIIDDWNSKLKSSLNKMFGVENIVDEWEFDSTNEFKWYLRSSGKETLYLMLDGTDFCLYANGEILDISQLKKLLREKDYLPILSAFERIDYLLEDDEEWYLISETGNFSFGDLSDNNIDSDSLAWYANYKTDDFAKQIQQKVDKFIKNKDITKLLTKLIDVTNIKNKKKKL